MRFLRVAGVQSGLVLLLMISAVIAALKLSEVQTSAAVQVEIAAPPDKKTMQPAYQSEMWHAPMRRAAASCCSTNDPSRVREFVQGHAAFHGTG